MHGDYELPSPLSNVSLEEINRDNSEKSNSDQENKLVPIKISYGYSRDQRPDLKQFMIDL